MLANKCGVRANSSAAARRAPTVYVRKRRNAATLPRCDLSRRYGACGIWSERLRRPLPRRPLVQRRSPMRSRGARRSHCWTTVRRLSDLARVHRLEVLPAPNNRRQFQNRPVRSPVSCEAERRLRSRSRPRVSRCNALQPGGRRHYGVKRSHGVGFTIVMAVVG